jgi:hypothetical protein
MAATTTVPVTLDTPIVVKVLFRGQTKKFKLPLKDLGAHVLPEKVRNIPRTGGHLSRRQPLKFQKKWDISRPQQNVGLIEAIILSLLSAILSDFSMRGPSGSCFPLLLQHERQPDGAHDTHKMAILTRYV